MKTYRVYVESRIKEVVEVDAENYEQAEEYYYDGIYDKFEEIGRQVLDTNVEEI